MCLSYYFLNVHCFLKDDELFLSSSYSYVPVFKRTTYSLERREHTWCSLLNPNLSILDSIGLWVIQSGPLSATLTQVQTSGEFPCVPKSSGPTQASGLHSQNRTPPHPPPPVLETFVVSSFQWFVFVCFLLQFYFQLLILPRKVPEITTNSYHCHETMPIFTSST